MNLPPLSTLRAFEAAARHGGFSPAGAELNVTHAAVAQQVRRLEAHLGVQLMRRRGRGMELTPIGARLADGVGRGLGTISEAIEAIMEIEASRPLKITLTPMVASTWLLPRLGGFRAAHPEIELMLDPSPRVVDLKEGDYDLAIRYGGGQWRGLVSERLIPSQFVVVVASRLLESLPKDEPPDIRTLPWLQEQGTDELRTWLASRGIDAGQKTNIIHLPGYMTLTALRDGQGVAAITRVFVDDDIRAGRLTVLYEDDQSDVTGYHLAWPEGDLRPPARAFRGWALGEAARTANAGPG